MTLRLPLLCASLAMTGLPARARPPAVPAAPLLPPTPSIAYPSTESDATARGLANQPQFSGVGTVLNGDKTVQGTGVAIAANWVLTAKHLVAGYTTATFYAANGQTLTGTVYTDSATDLALINLSSPLVTTTGQSHNPVALVTPNLPGAAKISPVGQLVWNVGDGNYGTYPSSANMADGYRRAGTNLVDSTSGNSLLYKYDSSGGTEFECTAAPGDNGGPMFLQVGYQWLVAGVVTTTSGTNEADADVAADNFLTTTTGLIFAPQAAPAALTWNTNYLSPATAASKSLANFADGPGNWDTTRLNFVGTTAGGDTDTYAWQNGTLLPVDFGAGSGAADVVTLTTPITVADLTFAAPGSGTYTLTGNSANPLTVPAAGLTVTTKVNGTINAVVAGTGALTKAGAATLTLGGTSTYPGGTNVNAGRLAVTAAGALGNSGDLMVANAATLDLSALASTPYTLAAGRTLTANGTVVGPLGVSGTLTGTGILNGGLTVNSGGTISGTTGTLTVTGAVINNGTIRCTGGSTLNASGATSFVNNGVLDLLTGGASLPVNFVNGANGVVLTSSLVQVASFARTDAAVTITINGYTGHAYQLQRSDSLMDAFVNLGDPQNGSTGTTLTFTDSAPMSGQGFYRVVLSP